ncbi:30S ribosomal protein S7 [bacterium]|nr:30S ribosomal protein S7 [bacterium]
MPRRREVPKRLVLPEPKYNDVTAAKFINMLMLEGKKSVAEKIFYGALERVEGKLKENGLDIFKKALNNIRPELEVKSRRVGGATYQVPVEVNKERSIALAMRWLVTYSRKRAGKTMVDKLSGELMDAISGKGASIKKKDDTHKMAEANKAFAHYRW